MTDDAKNGVQFLDDGLASWRHQTKERTMDHIEHKDDVGTWLRRAWNTALRTVEAMEMGCSPIDELHDRIERLEREVVALKKEGLVAIEATGRSTT